MIIQEYKDNISVTNDIESKQGLLISPNILFINKPYKKDKKTLIKVIIWFDIKSNGIKYEPNKIKPNIKLEDFKFNFNNLKPQETKNEVINISLDSLGHRIDNTQFFTYEIDTSNLTEENHFKYSLSYTNKDNVGLTVNGQIGGNRGLINLYMNTNKTNDGVMFNNISAFLNNDSFNNKQNVIYNLETTNLFYKYKDIDFISNEHELLEIKKINEKYDYKAINSLNYLKSIIEDSNNTQKYNFKLNNIYHISENEKTKMEYDGDIENNNNNYIIKLNSNYKYDFHTNKIIESKDSETILFNNEMINSNLVLHFEFMGKEFELALKFKKLNIKLENNNNNNNNNNLKKYIEYNDLKKNITYEDFINYRKVHINDEN